jgi:hypothetical protein
MMRVESAHDECTWRSESAIRLPPRNPRRSARRMSALRHNNSLNRSGISVPLIVNLDGRAVDSRPVNSGVGRLLILYEI